MSALYILPFDHRGSFQKMLFAEAKELSEDQKNIIRDYKRIIFDSMLLIGKTRGYSDLAILVDEEYGAKIHEDCATMGIRHILTTEKSGQKIFDFEYPDWKQHLNKIKPTYAKALIRVIVTDDNSLQNTRLKELQDFCMSQGMGFLIEPLIEPNEADLVASGGDKKRFDRELRPQRFAEAVKEMHSAGITPDVWKIEGTETREAMEVCSNAVFSGARAGVQIVILGRGETQDRVDEWLKASATVKGVNGFAIGRTVFGEPISLLHQGKLSRDQAIEKIAQNYQHGIKVFEEARRT